VEHRFGLIGFPLEHSFSPAYFNRKFEAEGLTSCHYTLIPVPDVNGLPDVLRRDYQGFNVTVPYKTSVMPYLNAIDPAAHAIGAVNTIARPRPNVWKGYNTDAPAFADTLVRWYGQETLPSKALVLGSGGSAKAVIYALQALGISPVIVSRSAGRGIPYERVDASLLATAPLIINCTPLGTWPKTTDVPSLPYELLDSRHSLYDLVYNPAESVFLYHGRRRGARVKNGLEMLHRQADLAWSIWQSYDPDLT